MSSQKEERGKRVQPHVLQPTHTSPSLVDGEPRPAGLFSEQELNSGANGGEEGGGRSGSLFSSESLRTQARNPSSHYSGSMMMARDCDKSRKTQGLSLGKGPKASVAGSWTAPIACHRYHSDQYVDVDFLPGRSGVQRDISPGVVREARLEGTVVREQPAARAPVKEAVPNPVRVVRGVSEAYCDEDFLGPPSATKRIHDARFDGLTSGAPRAVPAASAPVAVNEWQQRAWYRPVTLRGTIQGTPEFGYSTEDYYPRSMRSPKVGAKAAPAGEGAGMTAAAGERFDADWSNVVERAVQPYRSQGAGVRVQMHTGQHPCLTGVRVCDKMRTCLEKGDAPPERELEVRHLSHLGDTMCFLGERGDISTAEQYHSDDFWTATNSCSARMRAAKLAAEAAASSTSGSSAGTGAGTGVAMAAVKHVPPSEDEKRDRERMSERRAAPSSTTGTADQRTSYGEVPQSTFADAKAGARSAASAAPASVAAVSELFDWDPDPAFTAVSGQLGRVRSAVSSTPPPPLSLAVPSSADEQATVAASPSQYCTPVRAASPHTLPQGTDETARHESFGGPFTRASGRADVDTLYGRARGTVGSGAVDSEEDGFGDGEYGEHMGDYGALLEDTDTPRADGSYSYISTPSAASSTAWTSTPFARGLRGRFPGRRAPTGYGYGYGREPTSGSVRGVGAHPMATCMASWDEGYDYYGLDDILRQLEERGQDVSGAGSGRGGGGGENGRGENRPGGAGQGAARKKGGGAEDDERKDGDRHERVGSADTTARLSSRYTSQRGGGLAFDAVGCVGGLHTATEDSSTPASIPTRHVRRAAARPLSLRARPPWRAVRTREASADGVGVFSRRGSDDAADGLRGSRVDRALADANKQRTRVFQRVVDAAWSGPWTISPSYTSTRSGAASGAPHLSTSGADAHARKHTPTASRLGTHAPPHNQDNALPLPPAPSVPAPGTSLSSIASLPLAYTASLLSGTAGVAADLAYAGVRAGEQALGAVTQAAAEVVAGARGAVGEVALVMGAGPHFLLKDGLVGAHAHLRSPHKRSQARRAHSGHISSRTHVRPRIRLFPLAGARGMQVSPPPSLPALPPASPSPLPVEAQPTTPLSPLEDISPRVHARAHAHASMCPHPDTLSSLRCRCDVFPLERDAVEGEGGVTGLLAAMLPPQPRPRLPAARARTTALAPGVLAVTSGASALDADISCDAHTPQRRGRANAANGSGVWQRVARGGAALVRAGTGVSSALMSGHVAVAVSEVVDAGVRGAARAVGVGVSEVCRLAEALVETTEEAIDAGADAVASAGEEMWGARMHVGTPLSGDVREGVHGGGRVTHAARGVGDDGEEENGPEESTRHSHRVETAHDTHTSVAALIDQVCARDATISPSLCPHAARHAHAGRAAEHSHGLGTPVHEAVQGDDTLFSRSSSRPMPATAGAEDEALVQRLARVRARVLSLGEDDGATGIAHHNAAVDSDLHASSGSSSSSHSSPQRGSGSSTTSSSSSSSSSSVSAHGRNEDAISTPSDSDEGRHALARVREEEQDHGRGVLGEASRAGAWWTRQIGDASTVVTGMGTGTKTTAHALLASLREDGKEDMRDAHGSARGMGWGMLVGGLRGGGDTKQERTGRSNNARMGISAGKSVSGGGKGGASSGKRTRTMSDECKSTIHDLSRATDAAANTASAVDSRGATKGSPGEVIADAAAHGSSVNSSTAYTPASVLKDNVASEAESRSESARRRQVLCELKQDFIASTHKTLFPEEDENASATPRREPADHTAYQPFGYTYVSERAPAEHSPTIAQVAAGGGEDMCGKQPNATDYGLAGRDVWAADCGRNGPHETRPADGGDAQGSGRECGGGAAARGSAGGARHGNDYSSARRPRTLTLDTFGDHEHAGGDGEDGDGNADGRAPAFSAGPPWLSVTTHLTPPPLTHTLSSPSLQVPFDAHMPPVPAVPRETLRRRAGWTAADSGRNGPSLRESVLRSTVSQTPVLLLDDAMPIVSPGVLACARRDAGAATGPGEEVAAVPARGAAGLQMSSLESKDGGRGDVESPPQVHAQLHPAATRISTIVNRNLGIPTATSPHPEAELRTPGGSLFGDGDDLQ